MHTHTYTHIYIYICIYTYIHKYVYVCICIFIYLFILIYIYMCVYVCVYIYICICTCTCICICVYVCVYVYVYLDVHLYVIVCTNTPIYLNPEILQLTGIYWGMGKFYILPVATDLNMAARGTSSNLPRSEQKRGMDLKVLEQMDVQGPVSVDCIATARTRFLRTTKLLIHSTNRTP